MDSRNRLPGRAAQIARATSKRIKGLSKQLRERHAMRWAVALHRLPGRLIQSCINPRASFPNDLDTPQKSIRGQRSAIVNIAQYQMSGTILRVTSVSATRKLGFSRTRRSIALSASAGRSAGGWRWPLPGSSRSSASITHTKFGSPDRHAASPRSDAR